MTISSDPMAFRRVALIGGGAVAGVLASALVRCGWTISVVVSTGSNRSRRLAENVGAPWTDEYISWEAPVVLLAISDDALEGVAEKLAASGEDWYGRFVFHTSGVHTSSALASLQNAGAQVSSLHPLQSFTSDSGPESIVGAYAAIEGPEGGLHLAERMAVLLGMHPVHIQPADRPLYHAAAAMASNYTVTLSAIAREALTACGPDPATAIQMLRPLVEGTLSHLRNVGPDAALTGPIVRGDADTVRGHLEALAARVPHLVPVYAALGVEAVRLSVRAGRLDAFAADPILECLFQALTNAEEDPGIDG